jgi:RNA polymerase sigma-70 factor (ECF subfamily)
VPYQRNHSSDQEALQQQLVEACKGDAEAFARLVEQYQAAVYNLCYRMLGNANDAEDAAQETFLRAFKGLHRYDHRRKFSTWLLSIASHYCIDQLRKRRLFTLSLDAMPNFLVDGTIGPEASLITQEKQQQVQVLLQTLNAKDKVAVVLRYWYDFSYDEIAEVLSLSNSAVKSRLHRARRALAQRWLEQESQTEAAMRSPYGANAF